MRRRRQCSIPPTPRPKEQSMRKYADLRLLKNLIKSCWYQCCLQVFVRYMGGVFENERKFGPKPPGMLRSIGDTRLVDHHVWTRRAGQPRYPCLDSSRGTLSGTGSTLFPAPFTPAPLHPSSAPLPHRSFRVRTTSAYQYTMNNFN